MDVSRMWFSFKKFLFFGRLGLVHNIRSPEQFHAVIRREQNRADRSKNQFSLILFATGDLRTNKACVQCLTHILADRIRSTDEAGWFDERRIGVLLPYTSITGAQTLASEVCQSITAKLSCPKCTVYTYPSKLFPDNEDHSANLQSANLSDESDVAIPNRLSNEHEDEASITHAVHSLLIDEVTNGESLSQVMCPVFRPLKTWQRATDVVCALLGLVVFSPLLLIIVLIIKNVSTGPVFFKQKRVGYMGKLFSMWKFRTMKINADTSTHQQYVCSLINSAKNGGSNSPMIKLDNDPQIIPFGRILRKTCIDELPQLINVLRGEMSLVGPRPAIPYEVKEYSQWNFRRLDVLPGMTGLWQVSGKNRLSFINMMRLDICYSKHKSLFLDMMIILKTPLAIFSQLKTDLQEKRKPIMEVLENV